MESFWHPLSSLLLDEPRAFVTAAVLRRLVSRGREVPLVYAGDRMWPAVSHGQTIRVGPLPAGPVAAGSAVVACPGRAPELPRVAGEDAEGLAVFYDADPAPSFRLARGQVVGMARLDASRPGRALRVLRRLRLDWREAFSGDVDDAGDAARTVMVKYDVQAPFYSKEATFELPGGVIEQMRRAVAPGSRVLVAGSGTGRECFRLEQEGWKVTGIDFADAMVALSRQEASRRGSQAIFHQGDLRSHDESAGSLGAVLFTYDVYSFLPVASERIALLRRMAAWLSPDGVVLISARRIHSWHARLILTLQWLRRGLRRLGRPRRGVSWGASHTRWIAPDGRLRRSFVQHFSDAGLRREIERAGWRLGAWEGGHAVLRRPG